MGKDLVRHAIEVAGASLQYPYPISHCAANMARDAHAINA